ncbi:MAG: peptidoglycan-associated lipoprotein Pal [Thermodesulfovibrionia bacterium]|nr:peptidoglycan-associated lipoprotein Pal [Thermodesulfovibrionia bacterium]
MKKILILLLMVLVIGCGQQVRKDGPFNEAARCRDDLFGGDGRCEDAAETLVDLKDKKEIAAGEHVITESVLSEDNIKDIDINDAEVRKEIDLVFKDVLFDYDQYSLRDDARAQLDLIASWLVKNRKTNLIIEGHCDERGTNEYNLALGEKRARAASEYLALVGVSSSRITAITYGEEKPACTVQDESCWQRNRRDHFVVTE